jgi:DNA-binding transcriptional MerR regulator
MNVIEDAVLDRIEKQHARGLTSAEILDLFARHDIQLSEATLRKYVQLGLLPRSVRVGQKGKHKGSQGIYPVSVVRQILAIKEMMAQSYTIEQIQRQFLFVRSDLQQLGLMLDGIFRKMDRVLSERRREAAVQAVTRELGEARVLGKDLLARLEAMEARLVSRARIDHVAAS